MHYSSDLQIIQYLIEEIHIDSSIKDNKKGRNLLFSAWFKSRDDIFRYLLEECHLDPSESDYQGITVINLAKHAEHRWKIRNYLVQLGYIAKG